MKPVKKTPETINNILDHQVQETTAMADYIKIYDNLTHATNDPLDLLHKTKYTFKTDEMAIITGVSGYIEYNINEQNVKLEAHQALIVMPDSIIQVIGMSDDFRYTIYIISQQMLNDTVYDLSLTNNWLLKSYFFKLCDLTDEDFNYFISIYNEIKNEFARAPYNYQRLTTRCYGNIILTNCIKIFDIKVGNDGKLISRQDSVFRKFIDLLNMYSSAEREVKFYADKLGITPKYLSSVSVTYSGKNASSWIDEYVISKAKMMMREQTYNIKQISEALNFPSQSFFGRYFKRVTGKSPKAFILGLED